MAQLNVQNIPPTGLPRNLVAASVGGDTVKRGDSTFLVVANGGGSAITVTLDTPGTTHGLAVGDQVINVAAGTTVFIPLTDEIYVHPDDHLIHLAYSGVTTVTVGAFSL